MSKFPDFSNDLVSLFDKKPKAKRYNCTDCEKLIRPENLYGHGIDNVCLRCYAIRAKHPSTRVGK
jgi:hypothetical protein